MRVFACVLLLLAASACSYDGMPNQAFYDTNECKQGGIFGVCLRWGPKDGTGNSVGTGNQTPGIPVW